MCDVCVYTVRVTNCRWQTVPHDWPGHRESSVAKFRPRTWNSSWCRSPSGADSVSDHCCCRGVQNRSGSLGTDVCGSWTSPVPAWTWFGTPLATSVTHVMIFRMPLWQWEWCIGCSFSVVLFCRVFFVLPALKIWNPRKPRDFFRKKNLKTVFKSWLWLISQRLISMLGLLDWHGRILTRQPFVRFYSVMFCCHLTVKWRCVRYQHESLMQWC